MVISRQIFSTSLFFTSQAILSSQLPIKKTFISASSTLMCNAVCTRSQRKKYAYSRCPYLEQIWMLDKVGDQRMNEQLLRTSSTYCNLLNIVVSLPCARRTAYRMRIHDAEVFIGVQPQRFYGAHRNNENTDLLLKIMVAKGQGAGPETQRTEPCNFVPVENRMPLKHKARECCHTNAIGTDERRGRAKTWKSNAKCFTLNIFLDISCATCRPFPGRNC